MILFDTPTAPVAIMEICERVVASCGFVLVDARMQGKSLEATIFHPHKDLSLDDCEQLSFKLNAELEQHHLGLLLDVQSPGIDRRLKTRRDFEVFTGQTVEIALSQKMFGLSDCFVCRLAAFSGDSITVNHLVPHTVQQEQAGAKGARSPAYDTSLIPGELIINLNQVNTVKLFKTPALCTVQ